MVRAWQALCLVTLASCSSGEVSPDRSASNPDGAAGAMSQTHPESGLRIIPVTVDTDDASFVFQTELADTSESQTRGLMYRTQLGDDEAMLFPSSPPQVRSFWMKNTPLPLDIIFVGTGGRIINIESGVPYSTESVRSDGPAAAVFEIRGGRAAQLGIEPGDRIVWDGGGT